MDTPIDTPPRKATPPEGQVSQAQLLAAFGEEYLSIQSFFHFCFVPGGRIGLLKELASDEEWGTNNYVLLKYLAIHIRMAIEQGCYVWNDDQIVLTAGHLTTANGNPVYVGLVENNTPEDNPWVMNWVGERPSCPHLPDPPELGEWGEVHASQEIVIAFDIGDGAERRGKATGINAPEATQIAALAGAAQWALHRGLEVKQIHGGGRGYFVPLYLKSREDLAAAPDFVAPLTVQKERLIVRTLLEPHVAYSPARAVVERWEQLPSWLVDAWDIAIREESDAVPTAVASGDE